MILYIYASEFLLGTTLPHIPDEEDSTPPINTSKSCHGTQNQTRDRSARRASRWRSHRRHCTAVAIRPRCCRRACVKRGTSTHPSIPPARLLTRLDPNQRPFRLSRQPRTPYSHNAPPRRSAPLRPSRPQRHRQVHAAQSHRRRTDPGHPLEHADSTTRPDARDECGGISGLRDRGCDGAAACCAQRPGEGEVHP